VFRRRDFFQGRPLYGSQVHDIVWLQPDGGEMTEASWSHSHARALAVFLAGEGLNEVDGRARRRSTTISCCCSMPTHRRSIHAAGRAGRALGELLVDTAGRRCAGGVLTEPAPGATCAGGMRWRCCAFARQTRP
jgi:pullulanase/glycogen debranching enzyme